MGNRNGKKELNARLGDYSVSARLAAAATTLRGRLDSWPKYAAVAGSALAMATGASASIITNSINGGVVFAPHTVHSTGQKLVSFQSLAANLNDFVHLKASSGTQSNVQFAALAVAGTGGGGVKLFEAASNSQLARIFTSHSRISAGAIAHACGSGHTAPCLGSDAKIVNEKFATSAGFGQFQAGQSGFAGMQLKTTHGAFDYGWLKLKFTDLGGLPNMLEAISYGIETNPGTPIFAGQTVEATPEPGTMGLALLAAGALGVTALRRRKMLAR